MTIAQWPAFCTARFRKTMFLVRISDFSRNAPGTRHVLVASREIQNFKSWILRLSILSQGVPTISSANQGHWTWNRIPKEPFPIWEFLRLPHKGVDSKGSRAFESSLQNPYRSSLVQRKGGEGPQTKSATMNHALTQQVWKPQLHPSRCKCCPALQARLG